MLPVFPAGPPAPATLAPPDVRPDGAIGFAPGAVRVPGPADLGAPGLLTPGLPTPVAGLAALPLGLGVPPCGALLGAWAGAEECGAA